MKLIKLLLAIVLLGMAGLGNAWADHGHARHGGHFDGRGGVRFGVMIGPYWSPWYSPLPYYYPPYYPPVVVERDSPPVVYIEQQALPAPAPNAAAAPAPQTNYWYYCGASKAYYPYVRECPSGWQKVLPQPPGQP